MLAQVLAIIIFLAMFLLIILEIWERQWITLACGLLTLLLVFGLGMHSMGAIMRTLNLQSFFTTGFWYAAGESSEASSGINWQTIIFIRCFHTTGQKSCSHQDHSDPYDPS